MNLIESFGTGIQRIRKSYEGQTAQPEFSVYENSIRIVLPMVTSVQDVTADEEAVLKVLSDKILMSRENVDRASGFDKSKTIRVLKSLLEKHLIVKKGNGRGTKYRRIGS